MGIIRDKNTLFYDKKKLHKGEWVIGASIGKLHDTYNGRTTCRYVAVTLINTCFSIELTY